MASVHSKMPKRKVPRKIGRGARPLPRQRGAVIIIVLWTAALLTIMVTAMAGNVRLSARTAFHNQELSYQWSALMAAVHQAEMEIIMETMPRPVGEEQQEAPNGEIRIPNYRFNGRPLELAYPQSDDIIVRAYNHSGKINLNRIPRRNMQLLIEKRLGGPEEADPDEVQALLAAWTDWTDLNDLEGLDGAERDYYESLDTPYAPRNNPELDSVEELLQVRGFAELFEGVNLEAAFTIYGNTRVVNLNFATREAMQLLPGLDDELIETIIAYREIADINDRGELAEIIPFENMQELSAWVGTNTGNFFTLFAYPRRELDPELEQRLLERDGYIDNPDPVRQAYMEIIEVRGYNNLPIVYRVDPYGRLPDTAAARYHLYDIELPSEIQG